MSQYRSQNRIITAKLEVEPGTDAEPTIGANAVLVARPTGSPNLNSFETGEVSGSLDDRAPIPSSGNRPFRAQVFLKGPGANVGTTAPEVDPFLKACAMARVDLAADLTGTATAGAASTITLAVGASSTSDIYKGFVIETTDGTGPDQKRIISGYNGSTKVATVTPAWTVIPDATTVYAVRKGSLYRPTSDSLPLITIYEYLLRSDGGSARLRKTVGAAGNATLTVQASQGCSFQLEMIGQLVPEGDVSDPGEPTYQANRPFAFQKALVHLGDTAIKLRDLSINLGNRVQQIDDPSTDYGMGVAGVTGRQVGGTFQAPMELLSVRDAIASWQAGTAYMLSLVWGPAAGNRLAILVDKAVYTGVSDADQSGFGYEQLPFRCNANDGGFSLLFW